MFILLPAPPEPCLGDYPTGRRVGKGISCACVGSPSLWKHANICNPPLLLYYRKSARGEFPLPILSELGIIFIFITHLGVSSRTELEGGREMTIPGFPERGTNLLPLFFSFSREKLQERLESSEAEGIPRRGPWGISGNICRHLGQKK